MKILSWNINGIRAVIKKGFLDFLKIEKPDILCLQEIKICEKARQKENFTNDMFPGYKIFYNSAKRPGYSGTAVLIREFKNLKAYKIKNGMGVDKFDDEGRTQIIEAKNFYLINNYFPNANHELSRLNYKLEFNNALLKKAKSLEKKLPVIITGDFNVAHMEIDLARPKENVGNPGFTFEERDWMTRFLEKGFIDTFRYKHPKKQEYSWWSYRAGARPKNIGWRIDYFCVSAKMINQIEKSFIQTNILGSDHCPVGIQLGRGK